MVKAGKVRTAMFEIFIEGGYHVGSVAHLLRGVAETNKKGISVELEE